MLKLPVRAYWKHWQYWHWRGCGLKMTERGQSCYISNSPLLLLKQHKNTDTPGIHVPLTYLWQMEGFFPEVNLNLQSWADTSHECIIPHCDWIRSYFIKYLDKPASLLSRLKRFLRIWHLHLHTLLRYSFGTRARPPVFPTCMSPFWTYKPSVIYLFILQTSSSSSLFRDTFTLGKLTCILVPNWTISTYETTSHSAWAFLRSLHLMTNFHSSTLMLSLPPSPSRSLVVIVTSINTPAKLSGPTGSPPLTFSCFHFCNIQRLCVKENRWYVIT